MNKNIYTDVAINQ